MKSQKKSMPYGADVASITARRRLAVVSQSRPISNSLDIAGVGGRGSVLGRALAWCWAGILACILLTGLDPLKAQEWTSEDIGFPVELGSSVAVGTDGFDVTAGGADIWFNEDSFHFVHQTIEGDFDIRVRVESFGPAGANGVAKAALMVRADATSGSPHATITVYPASANWVAYQRFEASGGSSVAAGNWNVPFPQGGGYPNVWMRVRRAGNDVQLYGGVDGETWTPVGNPIQLALPESVLVGMATTSVGDQVIGSPMAQVAYRDFGPFEVSDATLTIVSHPESIEVEQNHSAEFSVEIEVTGISASEVFYAWYRDDLLLGGENQATLTLPQVSLDDDGAIIRVRVNLPGADYIESDPAVLTVKSDLTPAGVVSLAGLASGVVGIRFTESMDPLSVSDPTAYTIGGGAVVQSATLQSNGTDVVLVTSGVLDTEVTVGIDGVRDLVGNETVVEATGPVVPFQSQDVGFPLEAGMTYAVSADEVTVIGGGFDTWFNDDSFHFAYQERTGDFDVQVRIQSMGPSGVHGVAKAAMMIRESVDASSPHTTVTVYPTSRNWVSYRRTDFAGPSSVLGGNWNVAWSAGSGYPFIWMRVRRVGDTLTTFGSSDGREWLQVGDPHTPLIPYPQTVLVGVAATSVGDQFPGLPMVQVAFTEFGDVTADGGALSIDEQPLSQTVTEFEAAEFEVIAALEGGSATLISYQWFRDDGPISGETAALLRLETVTAVDDGARFRVRMLVPGGQPVWSDEVTLTVLPDEQAPSIVSAGTMNREVIGIRFNETIDGFSAADSTAYVVSGATVFSVFPLADGRTVVLVTSGVVGDTFTVSAPGVRDLAGNVSENEVTGQISDYVAQDIGFPNELGSTYSVGAGTYGVTAGGADIWGAADSFHFVERTLTGDFDMQVQLTDLGNLSGSTRAGLMVRETLMADSRNLFVGTYPRTGANNWVATVRHVTAGSTSLAPGASYLTRESNFAFPNAWFRIKRVGGTFTMYYSQNGNLWLPLGDQFTPKPPYPDTVHFGMAAVALLDAPGTSVAAQFDNLQAVVPSVEVPDLSLRWEDEALILSWPEAEGIHGLQSTGNVTESDGWIAVEVLVELVDGWYQVRIEPTADHLFYRLVRGE